MKIKNNKKNNLEMLDDFSFELEAEAIRKIDELSIPRPFRWSCRETLGEWPVSLRGVQPMDSRFVNPSQSNETGRYSTEAKLERSKNTSAVAILARSQRLIADNYWHRRGALLVSE